MAEDRIYISSTLKDLEAEREAVKAALEGAHIETSFQASEKPLIEKCVTDVRKCTLYVGIIGWRYGYVPEDAVRNPEKRSITELEYEAAGEAGIPRLIFLQHVDSARPSISDPFTKENPGRIDAFRARVASGNECTAAEFRNPDLLGTAALKGVRAIELERRLLKEEEEEDAPALGMPPAPLPETIAAFADLRAALTGNDEAFRLDRDAEAAVLNHSPTSDDEFRLARIVEHRQKYAVARGFTPLTLLIDRGRDAEGGRWTPEDGPAKYEDLSALLADRAEFQSIVVLGAPGSGKSTLLRRLELDTAIAAFGGGGEAGMLTFFVPLSTYRPAQAGQPLPQPMEWLAAVWQRRHPWLPPLAELLKRHRMVLLLDAINEMPHRSADEYAQMVARWQDLVATLPAGNRAVFSCRSLDYSGGLSTEDRPVPHVRIEDLSDEQVQAFLEKYAPDHAIRLWSQLEGTKQLDLFRTPYYLQLLIGQARKDGEIPAGRGALFTGFVRQALLREIRRSNALFTAGDLLHTRDRQIATNDQWMDAHDLPDIGPLFSSLANLAFRMQEQRGGHEAAEVRIDFREAIRIVGADLFDRLIAAGVALGLIEDSGRQVHFVHQLLQEFFAARHAVKEFEAKGAGLTVLATVEWRADRVSPTLEETVGKLGKSEPLPELPSTGWEETFVLAASMLPRPDAFIRALIEPNLVLAARCASESVVGASEAIKAELRNRLQDRISDRDADLRARIPAGLVLGTLGDPRFERRGGPLGDYIVPPHVEISGGTYSIGSEDGHPDERPVHPVEVDTFWLGKYPVTNAEYALFMKAGGYDDERWWDTEAARQWQRGESTSEGLKQNVRNIIDRVRNDPGFVEDRIANYGWTEADVDQAHELAAGSNEYLERTLDEWYPTGRQCEPLFWRDSRYNNPSQPVVGICWYEARAYRAWLSAVTGVLCRLPSEAEWEVAARGRVGRTWAMGSAFNSSGCNTYEGHVQRTTVVGVYPDDQTPEGVIDLSGNVRDWTTTVYQDYPYDADDGREELEGEEVSRVLRGGSWDVLHRDARAAYRNRYFPGVRIIYVGFRVLLSSPIISGR